MGYWGQALPLGGGPSKLERACILHRAGQGGMGKALGGEILPGRGREDLGEEAVGSV